MSTAFSIRLEETQHHRLKELAIQKNVSINMIFQKFVQELLAGRILCFTNEPRISLMAPPSAYVVVKPKKNNGDYEAISEEEAVEKAKQLKKVLT